MHERLPFVMLLAVARPAAAEAVGGASFGERSRREHGDGGAQPRILLRRRMGRRVECLARAAPSTNILREFPTSP